MSAVIAHTSPAALGPLPCHPPSFGRIDRVSDIPRVHLPIVRRAVQYRSLVVTGIEEWALIRLHEDGACNQATQKKRKEKKKKPMANFLCLPWLEACFLFYAGAT